MYTLSVWAALIRLRPQCHVLPVLASLKDNNTAAVTDIQSVVASKTRHDLNQIESIFDGIMLWWLLNVVASKTIPEMHSLWWYQRLYRNPARHQCTLSLMALMLCAC